MAGTENQLEINNHIAEKISRTKLTLENYYNNLLNNHEEREARFENLITFYILNSKV